MDGSDGMVAAFVVSTIGLGFFVYGKKQARVPQLVVGLVLMALPYGSPSAVVTWCVGGGVVAALAVAVRAGA